MQSEDALAAKGREQILQYIAACKLIWLEMSEWSEV